MEITKSFESGTTNRALLQEQLAQSGYTECVIRFNTLEVHNVLAADETAIDVIIAAHVYTDQTAEQEQVTLINLTKEDMLIYYRDALVSAAGNGATIATIYTQVLAYQTQNQKLTDLMLSLRTIEETGSGVVIDVGINAGKARYLQLFQTALSLWLI